MKKNVLLHCYEETGHWSIICFSDSVAELLDIWQNHLRCDSNRHLFQVIPNDCKDFLLNDIKDSCLVNICNNVAEYFAVGEYAILKKSYFKSAAWFEKAKNSASVGAEILENY